MRRLAAGILVLGMGLGANLGTLAQTPDSATTQPASDDPKVSVISLIVVREVDPAAMRAIIDSPAGGEYKTGVTLVGRVSLPAANVVSADKTLRVDKFADDKGTDFGNGLIKTRFGNDNDSQCYLSPDHRQCTFWLGSAKLPQPGADKLLLEGALNLQVGLGEKAAESKKLPLKLGQEYQCGDLNLKVLDISLQGDQNSLFITLAAQQPLERIKAVECTDENGKPVAVQIPERYGRGDPRAVTVELARPVKELTLRVVQYEKIDTVKVPVKLDVKVGL